MPQQNFTAQKVIYLSEIFCVHWKVRFFLPWLWNCFCLANLLRRLFSLQCWQGHKKDVAWGNQMSSIKSWLESQAAYSLWFLKVCQKSCVIWKWRQDWTKSIAGSFELPMYKSSNENVLEGVLIVDFEISFTTGLITVQSIWSFQRIQALKSLAQTLRM